MTGIDDIDQRILTMLETDGRATLAQLVQPVQETPLSTC